MAAISWSVKKLVALLVIAASFMAVREASQIDDCKGDDRDDDEQQSVADVAELGRYSDGKHPQRGREVKQKAFHRDLRSPRLARVAICRPTSREGHDSTRLR